MKSNLSSVDNFGLALQKVSRFFLEKSNRTTPPQQGSQRLPANLTQPISDRSEGTLKSQNFTPSKNLEQETTRIKNLELSQNKGRQVGGTNFEERHPEQPFPGFVSGGYLFSEAQLNNQILTSKFGGGNAEIDYPIDRHRGDTAGLFNLTNSKNESIARREPFESLGVRLPRFMDEHSNSNSYTFRHENYPQQSPLPNTHSIGTFTFHEESKEFQPRHQINQNIDSLGKEGLNQADELSKIQKKNDGMELENRPSTTSNNNQEAALEKPSVSNQAVKGPVISCLICYAAGDEMKNVCSSPCGHIACKECWTKWLKKKEECPMCKKPVKKRRLITLYLSFTNS